MSRAVPTAVVEQHGDALRYWPLPDVAPSDGDSHEFALPVTLVHFDSHSDLMEIPDDDAGAWRTLLRRVASAVTPPSRAERRQRKQEAEDFVQIGDFITAALWLGLVDDVVWVRSDFPSSQRAVYNGPDPGRYLVEVDWSSGRAADGPGADRGQPANAGDLVCFRLMHEWWSFNQTQVRGNSESAEAWTCGDGLGQPGPVISPRRFNLTVATAGQLLGLMSEPSGGGAAASHCRRAVGEWDIRCLRAAFAAAPAPAAGNTEVAEEEEEVGSRGGAHSPRHPARRRWILDVDLDFFASYDPSYNRFLASGFSERFARRLAPLLRTNGTCTLAPGVASADARVPSVSDVYPGLMAAVARLSLLVPRRHEPRWHSPAELVEGVIRGTSRATSRCRLGRHKAQALYRMIEAMSPARRLALERVFDHDEVSELIGEDFMHTIFLDMPGPHFANRREAARGLELFGLLLNSSAGGFARNVLGTGRGKPMAITVARSMRYDSYLPSHLWRPIERSVLDALRAAFGPLRLHYHDDLRPVNDEP